MPLGKGDVLSSTLKPALICILFSYALCNNPARRVFDSQLADEEAEPER